jgi:hypothetical protein
LVQRAETPPETEAFVYVGASVPLVRLPETNPPGKDAPRLAVISTSCQNSCVFVPDQAEELKP